MTKQYYNENKDLDRGVEMLINRCVLACQSGLICSLYQNSGADWLDDAENMWPDPSAWDQFQLENWLSDQGIDHPVGIDMDDYIEKMRDLVQDNAQPAEVYEWYLVTDTAANWLRNQGEVILEAYNCTWWGRQATGQSIQLDPTFYDIYQDNDLKWHEQ